jgi:hypothetical protein
MEKITLGYIPSNVCTGSPDPNVGRVLAVGSAVWLDGSHMKISTCTVAVVKIITDSIINYQLRPHVYNFVRKYTTSRHITQVFCIMWHLISMFCTEIIKNISSFWTMVHKQRKTQTKRRKLYFANTDVSNTKMCLDTSVFVKGNMDRMK